MPYDTNLGYQPVSSLYMPNDVGSGLQDLDFSQDIYDYIDMPSLEDSAFTTGESGNWWDSVLGFLGENWQGLLQAGLGVGSGIVGYNQSQQMQDMARRAFQQSDPFASQRGQYQQQLSDLMANPNSIFEDEGYIAARDQGLDAVERRMAAQGYLGSGNMATALSDYARGSAQQYRQQRIQELMTLSGAGISPNFGAAMSGQGASSDLLSQALASLGYGVGALGRGGVQAGGAGGGTPARNPNSAGGEAANTLRLLSGFSGLYGNLTGTDTSGLTGTLGGAAGIVGGAGRGGVGGAVQAGRGAAAVGGSMGLDTSNLSGGLAGLAGLLGIRQGIQQGGIRGGVTAGAGAAQAGTAIAGLASGGTGAVASGAAANAALAEAGFGGASSAAAGAGAAGIGAAGYLGGFAAAAPWIAGAFAVTDVLNGLLGNNDPGWDTVFERTGMGRVLTGGRNLVLGARLGNGRLISQDEADQIAQAMRSGDQQRFAQLMQTAGSGFNADRARGLKTSRGMYQGEDGFWYLPEG